MILRIDKNKSPDQEALMDAAQLAFAYSKAKDESAAQVSVTQCKFVSRMGKNQPGKVQISET